MRQHFKIGQGYLNVDQDAMIFTSSATGRQPDMPWNRPVLYGHNARAGRPGAGSAHPTA